MTIYKLTVFNDELLWFTFETDELDHLEAEKRRVKALGLNYNVTEHHNETQKNVTTGQ